MLDWITLLIEAVGLIILCIWVVLPIQEFKSIFHRLKQERKAGEKPANPSNNAPNNSPSGENA